MIIAIMFIAMLAFFACIMFIKQTGWRAILATIFGILFVGSTFLMTINYSHHFGMHQVTTTTKKTVYPVRTGSPLALYQPLGTDGTERVLIYKNNADDHKPTHTPANEKTSSQLKFSHRHNILMTTTTTRWRPNAGWATVLFAKAGTSGKLIHRHITITYPKTYVKVTTKQAQKLAKASRHQSGNAQAQAAGKAYVSGKVRAAMAKDPHMTNKQRKDVAQEAQLQFQSRMIKQALKQQQ